MAKTKEDKIVITARRIGKRYEAKVEEYKRTLKKLETVEDEIDALVGAMMLIEKVQKNEG